MTIRDILHYPDPRLRRRAEPVAVVDDDVRRLIADMFETMYAAPGIGLAATQVNVTQRVIVIDVSEHADTPRAFVNPEILELGGEIERGQEGCLSVPDVYEEVDRHTWARVRAVDPADGQAIEFEAEGLLAICIQHEIDHLDGKLFIDYLSELKRNRIRKRIEKEQRQAQADHYESLPAL
ncbi:MAG TPA: peptide deformylase [Gammaproteobacteria bacterium]|jgi:peptide deformylase|nr:peptide deformylase [Gammaproteobacteria bacterium]